MIHRVLLVGHHPLDVSIAEAFDTAGEVAFAVDRAEWDDFPSLVRDRHADLVVFVPSGNESSGAVAWCREARQVAAIALVDAFGEHATLIDSVDDFVTTREGFSAELRRRAERLVA